jgi:uncharacterized protein YydD (DUF2326 family)
VPVFRLAGTIHRPQEDGSWRQVVHDVTVIAADEADATEALLLRVNEFEAEHGPVQGVLAVGHHSRLLECHVGAA